MNRVLTFGLAVKKYRLARELSQEKLAELSGLHRNLIGLVERGKISASVESIFSICDALNIQPSVLFLEVEAETARATTELAEKPKLARKRSLEL